MAWPSTWERIDDVLTTKGINRLRVGQVLMFNYEGSRNDLLIMKITKSYHVWAKRITTHDPSQVLVDGVKLTDAAQS